MPEKSRRNDLGHGAPDPSMLRHHSAYCSQVQLWPCKTA